MNMSKTLIKYFYENGVFDLKKMKQLVIEKVINEDDFFDITRKVFQVIKNRETN